MNLLAQSDDYLHKLDSIYKKEVYFLQKGDTAYREQLYFEALQAYINYTKTYGWYRRDWVFGVELDSLCAAAEKYYTSPDSSYSFFKEVGKFKMDLGDYAGAKQDFEIAQSALKTDSMQILIDLANQGLKADSLFFEGNEKETKTLWNTIWRTDYKDWISWRRSCLNGWENQVLWRGQKLSETALKVDTLEMLFHHFSYLPKQLFQLSNLKFLVLYNAKVHHFPKELFQLKKLKYLYFAKTFVSKLPAEISQLDNLEVLELRHNRLLTLPSEIGQLHNLKYLDLRGNFLQKLPKSLKKLKNLEDLHLYYLPFSRFPRVIARLLV